MENELERNNFTGLLISKRDDSQELNVITGVSQDVKDKDVCKSNGILWPSISARDDDSESRDFSKHVPIFVSKADEQIVCGVVYEPDTVDAQGDQANAEEIRKAAYDFMENAKHFKVNHRGRSTNVEILESYIAPQALTIGKRKIKKGSWLITLRVNNAKIWKAIKDGKLTGFSMAGHARIDS